MPLPSEFVQSQIDKLEEAQAKLDALPEPLDEATQAEKDKVNADFEARRKLLNDELELQKATEADQNEKKSLGNTDKALKQAKGDYNRQLSASKKSKKAAPPDRTKLDEAEKKDHEAKKLAQQIAAKKKQLAALVAHQKAFHGTAKLGDVCVNCEMAEIDHVALAKRWNALSSDCRAGLRDGVSVSKGAKFDSAAKQRLAVLERALAQKEAIKKAVEGTGVDWTLVAAVGVRETGFVNKKQPNGQAVGIFQIDLGQNPDVSEGDAESLDFSAKWAAERLKHNFDSLKEDHPELSEDELWKAAAASYNRGLTGVKVDLNKGRSPDANTTGRNYGANVADLNACFVE